MKLYDDINLNRRDKTYIEIESFEDYEFTDCLAFELAIRNKDVLSGLFELLKINKILNIDESEQIIFSDKTIEQKLFSKIPFQNHNHYLEFIHIVFLTYKYKIDIKGTIDYLLTYYNNSEFDAKVDKTIKDCPKFESKPDFLDNLSIKCYYSSRISELLKSSSNTYSYDHDDISEMFQDSKAEHFVVQKLSRPKLTEPRNLNTHVHIMNINLNLPIDEIISYIEDIYKSFHEMKGKENPYILDSFSYVNSINGNKLYPFYSYIIYEENSFYNHRRIPKISLKELLEKHKITNNANNEINISKRLSKQDWADCFFIYDYYQKNKIGINEGARVLEEYFNYYYHIKVESTSKSKNAKPTIKKIGLKDYYKNPHLYIEKGINYKSYYSISTIKSRYKLMQELIENTQYIKLITG